MKIEVEIVNGLGVEIHLFHCDTELLIEYTNDFEVCQVDDFKNNSIIDYLFIKKPLDGGTGGLIKKIKKLESIMAEHPLWFKGSIGVYGGIFIQ